MFILRAFALSLVVSASAHAATSSVTKASLCGETNMKGKAIVHEKSCGQRLDVHVLRGCPLGVYEVTVNGEVVGCIVTNPGGSGRLRLSRDADWINPGDVITVGPVSGTFGCGN